MSYENRVICVDKHEIVVDRYSEIHIALNKGKVIQVEGLPDEWEYTVHDVEQVIDEYFNR